MTKFKDNWLISKGNEKKTASFVRYFYDSSGQILGRIETEDTGDSRAYDKGGVLVGLSYDGKSYNGAGELIALSDILSGLLVKEERVVVGYSLKHK